ncbi:M20 metallopeptidase family protein [Aliikangiella maris]|uniref:Amidohydrolase n=2 Tax=Aliikangiella maris TaxID=3162458 RepID=A0ABV3MLU5_9GAMM
MLINKLKLHATWIKIFRPFNLVVVSMLFSTHLSAQTQHSAVPKHPVQQAVERDYPKNLEPLFKHFHKNPELSFREFKTAKRLAKELRQLGVKVTEGVGGTGIVGIYENGSGPTVLVRADMDGLPVKEDSGLKYASQMTQKDINGKEMPVMHACGHDMHMTALVGTARQLIAHKKQWQGRLMLIGQPAEERLGGAKAMLADGLYEKFGVPDYALSLHVSSGIPAGKIIMQPKLAYSSADNIDITFFGVGAHGASPHQSVDPILLASNFVIDIQSIISRNINPLEAGVITVGSFHGGFKHNIIPDKVKLELTVRANNEAVRAQLLASIRRIAKGVAITAGLPDSHFPQIDVIESTPVTNNNPSLVTRLKHAISNALGEEILIERQNKGMGAEDFAYFTQTEHQVPGAYFNVGGQPTMDNGVNQPVPAHHSPFFKIEPQSSLINGVSAMTIAVLELLKTQ